MLLSASLLNSVSCIVTPLGQHCDGMPPCRAQPKAIRHGKAILETPLQGHSICRYELQSTAATFIKMPGSKNTSFLLESLIENCLRYTVKI